MESEYKDRLGIDTSILWPMETGVMKFKRAATTEGDIDSSLPAQKHEQY